MNVCSGQSYVERGGVETRVHLPHLHLLLRAPAGEVPHGVQQERSRLNRVASEDATKAWRTEPLLLNSPCFFFFFFFINFTQKVD